MQVFISLRQMVLITKRRTIGVFSANEFYLDSEKGRDISVLCIKESWITGKGEQPKTLFLGPCLFAYQGGLRKRATLKTYK